MTQLSQATEPACIYRGVVTHARHSPVKHAFAYELFLFCIDLDQVHTDLFASGRWWPLLTVNCWGLASFHELDHMRNARTGPSDTRSLVTIVRDELEKSLGVRPTGRIQLLTNLTYGGYCFNPISVYYVWNSTNTAVETIIAEVTNTPWNEMHCYVLDGRVKGVQASVRETQPRNPSDTNTSTSFETCNDQNTTLTSVGIEARTHTSTLAALGAVHPMDIEGLEHRFRVTKGVSQQPVVSEHVVTQAKSASTTNTPSSRILRYKWNKAFHVSPFMDMQQEYDWLFTEPGTTLLIQSQNTRIPSPANDVATTDTTNAPTELKQRMLHTQLRLVRSSSLSLLHLLYLLLIAFPLLTWRIQLLIHWEAFRLWWKGVPLYPHPTGSTNAFVRTVEALMMPLMVLASAFTFLHTRKHALSPQEKLVLNKHT